MARFDPDVRPTSDPSYIGYSREPDKPKPNTALGDLFSGIGNVVGEVTGAVDQNIKGKIKNDVFAGVDSLRDGQGVSDANKALPDPLNLDKGGPASSATLVPGTPGAGTGGATESQRGVVQTNPVVEDLRSRAARLNEGYKQGIISDSYYYTQLDALNRQIRAKYPGYREEVDAMIKEVTGIVPANALRKELLQNIGSYQSELEKQKNDKLKYLRDNANYLTQAYGPEKYQQMLRNPDAVDDTVVRSRVGVIQAQELQVQQANRELELKEKAGKAEVKDYVEEATGRVSMLMDNTVTSSTQGTNFNKLMSDALAKQGKGISLNPDEQGALRNSFNQYRMAVSQSFDDMMNKPQFKTADGRVVSFAMKIGRDKVQELRAQAMDQVNRYETAIKDGDFGVLAMDQKRIDASRDRATVAILGDPTFATLAGISKELGGGFVTAITADPEAGSAIMKRTRSLFATQIQTGGLASIDDQLGRMIMLGKNDPKSKFNGTDIKVAINDVVRGVTDPGNSVNARIKFANHLFGTESQDFLFKRFVDTNGTRQQVYKMIVNDEMTKKMMELRGQGAEGQAAFDSYSKFASLNFGRLFKQDIDNITKSSNESDLFSIKWDEKTREFIPELTPKGLEWMKTDGARYSRGTGGAPNWSSILSGPTYKSIVEMNGVIKGYEGAAKASGKDIQNEVRAAFEGSTGFKVDGSSKPPAAPGMIRQMWDALTKTNPAASDPELKLQEKATQKYKEQTGSTPQKRSDALSLEKGTQSATYTGEGDHPVLAALVPEESGGDYNRLVGGNGTPARENLTDMTVAQVMEYQKGMKGRGHLSSAAGKYQIIQGTMKWLVDNGYLNPNDKFDEATQDKAGVALLEHKAGYKDYAEGKISYGTFLSRLENEWEAVKRFPQTRNRVFHALDKLNKDSSG